MDARQAQDSPELATLSALAHGGSHPHRREVLTAFAAALREVETDRAESYHDIGSAVLPAAARHYLERLMTTHTYEPRSEFGLRNFAKGEIQGQVKALLAILDARGVALPDELREQIKECTDPIQLRVWIDRAATADCIDDFI